MTARLTEVPLDDAVKVLADMAELAPVVIGRVLYITTKQNAQALQNKRPKFAVPPGIMPPAAPPGA